MRLATSSLVLLLMGFSLFHNDADQGVKINNPMLNDYDKEWKIIDSLESKELPKSALDQVEKLYQKVRLEKNQSQIIKCIIYRNKYLVKLEDTDPSLAIVRLENEVADEENEVAKSVLNSMLGQLYFIYAQNNQYKIRNRTYTTEEPVDIATWSIESLIKKSNELYFASVKDRFNNPEILKDYEAIVVPANDQLGFDPDLNSFLLHRVVQHFSNSQTLLTEPVNKYVMSDPNLLGSIDDFKNLELSTTDSLSFKYQALLAHQKLLDYLTLKNRNDELAYADLSRIEYVRQHLVDENKDSLYLANLESKKERNIDRPLFSEICFRLAKYYRSQGQLYRQNFDPKYKGLQSKAVAIANEGLSKYPGSIGANNCKSLVGQIQQKELTIQVEQVIQAQQPYLVYCSFKNIEQLHLKLYKLSKDKIVEIERMRMQDKKAYISSLVPFKISNKQLVDADNDPHAVEHILDGLALGNYLLVASEQSVIDQSELVVHGSFMVSNLAYATQNRSNKLEVLVYDRVTGKPISDAQVEVYESNYRRGNINYNLIGSVFTNSDGKTYFSTKDKRFSLVIKKNRDVLDLREQHYVYNQRDGGSYLNCNIFTDRNIYRPGQKVYFKGLLLNIDKQEIPKIKPSKKVKVILRDANSQIVKEASFKTNEFGTFNGDFDLPIGGLNGAYHIESLAGDTHVGSVSIRVEDYKRPKFEVLIDTLDINYMLGDTVAVAGLAKMFAGTPLDEVRVKYRVTRETQYPYQSWWRPYPMSPSQEIANGETLTSSDGSFSIDVPLIAGDDSGYQDAVFNYSVAIDVIDITGETQSATSYIKASQRQVFASLDLKREVDKAELDKVVIRSENINGKQIDANGIISIDKLTIPTSYLVERYWGSTDTSLVELTEWQEKVPSYAYKKNSNYDDLKVESNVLREGFNTAISKELLLKNKLDVGLYRVKTKVGSDEQVQYIQVNDFGLDNFATNKLLVHKKLKPTYEPGEEATLKIGANNKSLHVYYEEERGGKITFSKWIKLDKVKEQKIKIKEKDRGGVFVNLHYAINNRAYSEKIKINVPWSNKDLKLEFTSIRNKIAPGSEEQWQIKITGNKKENVSAELLATMYDASLDQFVGRHGWQSWFYPDRYSNSHWNSVGYRASYFNYLKYNRPQYIQIKSIRYPQLRWFGLNNVFGGYGNYGHDKQLMIRSRMAGSIDGDFAAAPALEAMPEEEMMMADGADRSDVLAAKSAGVVITALDEDGVEVNQKEMVGDLSQITPRTNLNETVFFFPDIKTDKEGNVTLNFTMNEALTKWRLLTMAHTKDFAVGFADQEITTFKNLMIFPNAPRFMRQGDKLHFSAKVHNMTDETLDADAVLELIDAVTEEKINSRFGIEEASQSISLDPNSSELLSWELDIPDDFAGLVKYRILASDGTYSDGEENYLPTLSNRLLVTETFPMNVKGDETRTFSFESFKEKSQSTTLTHQNFSIEYTSNPAWYAIQAMPYLMEYEHECSEQLFNKYFANILSSNVANSHPRIKQVFNSWKAADSDALLSNLSKNQELKSAVLAETPWVMAAKSEEEQKQNLGILFDFNRMSYEQEKTMNKLIKRQGGDGGFAWFTGGASSRYISQYIVEGLGHLRHLGVAKKSNNTANLIQKSISYIDQEIIERYKDIKEQTIKDKQRMTDRNIISLDVHYLYARSYFLDDHKVKHSEVYNYFLGQSGEYWTDFSLYEQAMICLILHRNGQLVIANEILRSLKERSIVHDELGRYWKTSSGYNWNQHPIEMQAVMIELFVELGEDQSIIDELRIWLLKNKQTNSWKTTKSTAAAIYALMINKGGQTNRWLLDNQQVEVRLGNDISPVDFDKAQAGTLYVKKSFDKSEITDQLSQIKITNSNDAISWGAAYWQYFEDLDNIKTFEDTPLQLKKQLYIEEMTDDGPQLSEVNDQNKIHQGDKVKVRIELRVDRSMEFIHMKDMRASGLEPINVISQYKWQDGLGYYESTKDMATHFFFSYLPRGTYVFEYPLRATHVGNFSNGITTIQSMYAPEFSSHSEGIKVSVN